ncbi:MAG TPA: DNA-formamidopyrimidine glycosylase [Candidatus Izemoplasmatales bacterium]|nr:DNA-formamidopyrimidine glycosylase [Candidatus Izemoplasmatales bacterium]
MPELPEVETVRQQLKPLIMNRTIIDIDIRYPKIIQMDIDDFKEALLHQTFTDIGRYGKYLLFELDQLVLVSHLRMEGKYYLYNDLKMLTKHDHIIFYLDNGLFLSYHDVRKFGTMELSDVRDVYELESLKKLGPEVNDTHINRAKIFHKIKGSQRAIKSILLDQTVMTGLGNIYVDESLFLSNIHPETLGARLSRKQVNLLIDSAQMVIEKAISLGGTTIRTYHSTMGVDGRFQNALKVHTKKGQPCPVCHQVIEKIKVGGRGTYFCPNCQRKRS